MLIRDLVCAVVTVGLVVAFVDYIRGPQARR